MKNVTIERIKEAELYNMGYCRTCQDWTRYSTEPDAENYDCPICGKNDVFGYIDILCEFV